MHSNHFKMRIRNKRISNVNGKKSRKNLFQSTIIDTGEKDDDADGTEVTYYTTVMVTDIPVEHHQHHHHNGHHMKNGMITHLTDNQSDILRNNGQVSSDNNHIKKHDNSLEDIPFGQTSDEIHLSNNTNTISSDTDISLPSNTMGNINDRIEKEYSSIAEHDTAPTDTQPNIDLDNVNAEKIDRISQANKANGNDNIAIIRMDGNLHKNADENAKNTRLLVTNESNLNDNRKTFNADKSLDHFEFIKHLAKNGNEPNHTTNIELTKKFLNKCIKCLKFENGQLVVLEDVLGQSLVLPTPPISQFHNANGHDMDNNTLHMVKSTSINISPPIHPNTVNSIVSNNQTSFTNIINRNESTDILNTSNTIIETGERQKLAFFLFFKLTPNLFAPFVTPPLVCVVSVFFCYLWYFEVFFSLFF